MPIARHAIGTEVVGGGDFIRPVVIAAPEPAANPDHLFTIDLCVGWRRVAEAPAAIFDGITRDLAAGEWRLAGAVDPIVFEPGFDLTDIDTVRVARNNTIVFAGFVANVASGVGGLTITASAVGDTFVLTGPDAWAVLASRVAYPSPGTGPPWADAWDIRSGQASTCAAGYITANLGLGALVDRRYPDLIITDTFAGSTGTWSARLQPLDQLVVRICRDGDITCRMHVDFDGSVEAELVARTDRSASVVISDKGGLTKIETVRVPALSTFVIAGGQGNLTGRTFAAQGGGVGAARRETFTDQTSLSTEPEVAQSAATRLALNAATLTARAELTDDAAAGLRYLIGYNVGDTVTIEIDDVRYVVAIDAVTFHVAPERSVIRPVLGAASDVVTGLIRDVAGLQTRLDTQIS